MRSTQAEDVFPIPKFNSLHQDHHESTLVTMSNPGGGHEAGEGSKPKKRLKPRSFVWNHFTKVEIDGHTKAKCKYCNEDLSYTQGTTTHLIRHLNSCNKVPNGGIAQPLTITENNERAAMNQLQPPTIVFGVGEEDRNFGLTQKKICEEQVKKAILACFPFAPPNIKKVGSSLMIMDMDMEKEICEYYQREKEKLVTQLGNLTSRVCFSIEIMEEIEWISIAAHYINDDFKLIKKLIGFKKLIPDYTPELSVSGIIGSCISDWKLGNKIFSFTTRDFEGIFLGGLSNKFHSKMLLDRNHDYYHELFIPCFKKKLEAYCSIYLRRNHYDELSHIIKIFKDLMVSPDIRLKFNEIAEEKGLPPVNVSLYKGEWKAIKGALLYKEVFCERSITEICQLDCIRWTELEKAAKYIDEAFNPIIDLLSNFKYPTSNLYFQNFNIIWDILDLADYYDDDDESCYIKKSLCVACVLDPRYKFTFFEYLLLKEDSYSEFYYKVTAKVRKFFHTLFGIYAKEEINQSSPSSSSFTNQGLSKNIGAYALC